MVGSLRSKCWTEIRFPYDIGSVRPGPIVNGHLHWLAYKKHRVIIKFNPQMNTFTEVPMPQPKHGDGDIVSGEMPLLGSLKIILEEMLRCW